MRGIKMEEQSSMAFKGKIGYNVARAKTEREEDILEMLYRWYCDNEILTIEKVRNEFHLTKKEFVYYIQQMIKHGYLEYIEEDGSIELTEFGKVQGAECLQRHQYLTQFFRMLGLEEENAKEDACRLEHVISEEAIQGICNFLNNGETYDRVIQEANLAGFYKEGTYTFIMGIYRMGVRYPRVLADAFYQYGDSIILNVNKEQSSFILCPKSETMEGDIWYRMKEKWKLAERTTQGFLIPTEAFTVTMNMGSPISEADAFVAFTQQGKQPKDKDFCELNVHIW